jgi:hypothetical protein
VQLDTEQPERRAVTDATGGWIIRIERGIDREDPIGRRTHEARSPAPVGRPHVTIVCYCANDDEWKLGKEASVLFGHVIPDETPAHAVHLLHYTDLLL